MSLKLWLYFLFNIICSIRNNLLSIRNWCKLWSWRCCHL